MGDPTKAKAKLGWNPNKTSFEELVNLMVDSDMAKVAFMVQGSRLMVIYGEWFMIYG